MLAQAILRAPLSFACTTTERPTMLSPSVLTLRGSSVSEYNNVE